MGRIMSRLGVAVGVVALVVIGGCTPPNTPSQSPSTLVTPSSSPVQPSIPVPTSTPAPSPTETWGPEQAAAIEAVSKFVEVGGRIGADPSAFTEQQMTTMLEEFGGGAALDATVTWYLRLKEHGYRFPGEMVVLSTLATRPVDDGRGTEVHVTRCQDQRQGQVVDKDDNPVDDDYFEIPDYNLRQYSVRKPPGEQAFRVFGFETINGVCP